ncbi:Uncharacterised protein [Vibrio cholerae]|nr:Uncharacterised protein [Vibrio cholerae]
MSSFAFASHLFFNRFHSGDQLVTAFRNRFDVLWGLCRIFEHFAQSRNGLG